jgi:hypothetical protein
MMGLGKDQQMQKGDDWDEDAAPVCEGGLAAGFPATRPYSIADAC